MAQVRPFKRSRVAVDIAPACEIRPLQHVLERLGAEPAALGQTQILNSPAFSSWFGRRSTRRGGGVPVHRRWTSAAAAGGLQPEGHRQVDVGAERPQVHCSAAKAPAWNIGFKVKDLKATWQN